MHRFVPDKWKLFNVETEMNSKHLTGDRVVELQLFHANTTVFCTRRSEMFLKRSSSVTNGTDEK